MLCESTLKAMNIQVGITVNKNKGIVSDVFIVLNKRGVTPNI